MPRRPVILSKHLPYHVTARVNNREPFPGDLNFIWRALSSELSLQATLHSARVHAFVVMPNHFHLLISTPGASISKVMQGFISSVTGIINHRNHRTGRIFQGRYAWSLIDSPLYYAHALKYVYRNPVKANLCSLVRDYPYSTIAGTMGIGTLPILLWAPERNLDRLLPGVGRDGSLTMLEAWLDQPHASEENEGIRRALQKKYFQLPTDTKKRKAVTLREP